MTFRTLVRYVREIQRQKSVITAQAASGPYPEGTRTPSPLTGVPSARHVTQSLWPLPLVLGKACALLRSNKPRLIKMTYFTYRYHSKLPIDVFNLAADCRGYCHYLNKIAFAVTWRVALPSRLSPGSALPWLRSPSPDSPSLTSAGFEKSHFLLTHRLPFGLRSWHGRNAKGRVYVFSVS